MHPHFGVIVWETFIRHKKQMDKTLAFNEITPLPYCFKVLQTCFGLPEFDTEKGQSSSFVPEPPAIFWTTGYIGLSVLTFFFLGWSLWVQICFVWSWLRYICWNYFTILSLNVPSFRLDHHIPLPWPFQQIPGRFTFGQNFRNFRFGGKWNTFRRFIPLENSQKKWKI